jgi:hypothetical protein
MSNKFEEDFVKIESTLKKEENVKMSNKRDNDIHSTYHHNQSRMFVNSCSSTTETTSKRIEFFYFLEFNVISKQYKVEKILRFSFALSLKIFQNRLSKRLTIR